MGAVRRLVRDVVMKDFGIAGRYDIENNNRNAASIREIANHAGTDKIRPRDELATGQPAVQRGAIDADIAEGFAAHIHSGQLNADQMLAVGNGPA